MKAVDQWMPRHLLASIEPLAKMLKHSAGEPRPRGTVRSASPCCGPRRDADLLGCSGCPSAIMEDQEG
jgi:hypothetical protein